MAAKKVAEKIRGGKPAILFVGTQMMAAGAQEILLTQAAWFHRQGYPVAAFFFYDKQGLSSQWQRQYPFPIVDLHAWRLDSGYFRNSLRLIGGLLRLFFRLLQGRFAWIEAVTPHSNLLAIPLAWLARIPVRVATHHGYLDGMPTWQLRLHGWLINSGLATHLVAVSDMVREHAIEIEKVKPERVGVILNGIIFPDGKTLSPSVRRSLRASLDVPDDAPLALTVGRLTTQKGHAYLLDAIPAILDRFPRAVFVFAGDGPLEKSLFRKVENLGIGSSVRFPGHRSDVPELLEVADLLVMPSLWEGLPLALLEAMSVALPVIATQVEGVEQVVEHGVSGVTVPPKSPEALSRAVIELLEHPESSRRMGLAGKKVVEARFQAERMCSEYEDLFLGLWWGTET